jgi:hypothetical protein
LAIYNIQAPGLGSVGSYQVSGTPFVSGGINVAAATVSGTPLEISFPSVTRWILVKNHDNTVGNSVKIGASALGVDGDNFLTVNADRGDYTNCTTPKMELKLTKLYLIGDSTNVDVIAGLTGIDTKEIPSNWSGSVGVG